MGDINTGISEAITTEQQPASIWDGYVFTSHESDCELVINPSLDFEHWFINQDFYINMRFIHGDNLFSKDGDVYRVLPVQMAYQVWISRTKSLDNMEQCYIQIKKERDDQQAQVMKLKEQLTKLGYTDKGGELMKPSLGDQPNFNLLDQYKSQVECLKVELAGANERAQILLHKKNTMVDSLKSEQSKIEQLERKLGAVTSIMQYNLGHEDYENLRNPDYVTMLNCLIEIKNALRGGL